MSCLYAAVYCACHVCMQRYTVYIERYVDSFLVVISGEVKPIEYTVHRLVQRYAT